MKIETPEFSAEEVDAIRTTFDALAPQSRTFALSFYRTLFELDPGLRALFHGDMSSQGQKLMDMLDFIASHLEDMNLLLPAVRALGERHAQYRVAPEHYETVGAALTRTMRSTLGPEFSEGAAAAWTKAYSFISAAMVEAAEGSER